jgi:DNA end-binding protein Ku
MEWRMQPLALGEENMALRPLRTATITFGLVSIPVKFYTATSSEDISFNLLHAPCGSRVNRKYWCAEHDSVVGSDELIRGYQISKGRYVTFTDEELEALESDGDRALEITEFVALDQIDPLFFEKTYYLGPSTGGAKTYGLLAAAMRKQGKVALARWIANNREHLVLLRPFRDGLILHTMYYADEVRVFDALEIEEAEVKEKEIRLAEMLIDELTEEQFDPLRYKDEYRQRVIDRIEAKSKGATIVAEPRQESAAGEVVDIMEALRRSLEGARPAGRKPAARSAPKKSAPAKSSGKRRIS